jgi:hypothetical protein
MRFNKYGNNLNEKPTVNFDLGRRIGSKEAAFCQQHFVD